MMGRRLHLTGNVDDLARQLEKTSQKIPQENTRVLYHSFARHVTACIQAIATSPLVRLVEGKERWESPDRPQAILPQNWGGTELKRTVTCMVLKATITTVVQSSPLP
ncbi:hypothetical protein TNCV_4950321 [Trichonephila clavipes]|nr:hypothetical protein TNCV_4950321 [Trichonephila clavipes]